MNFWSVYFANRNDRGCSGLIKMIKRVIEESSFFVGLICDNRDTSCEKVQMSQDELEDHDS